MNTKANEIKRITLSLNFNDENEYRFFVQLRGRTYTEDLWDLSAVNSVWEEFTLGAAMGKALMRPLVQLDHATKVRRRSSYEPGFWRLHSPRKKRGWRQCMQKCQGSTQNEDEPTAEVSAPAACMPSTDVNVIQGEFSPKAK
jgi:hypothetical protein